MYSSSAQPMPSNYPAGAGMAVISGHSHSYNSFSHRPKNTRCIYQRVYTLYYNVCIQHKVHKVSSLFDCVDSLLLQKAGAGRGKPLADAILGGSWKRGRSRPSDPLWSLHSV